MAKAVSAVRPGRKDMGKGGGRGKARGPQKLTPETRRRIVAYVMRGAPMQHAAEAGGVSRQTMYEWLRAGANAKTGVLKEFADEMAQAVGYSVMRHLEVIDKAGQEGAWQASAWMLERRFPEDFGRRVQVDAKMEVKLQAQVVAAVVPMLRDALAGESPEVAARVLARAEAAAAKMLGEGG